MKKKTVTFRMLLIPFCISLAFSLLYMFPFFNGLEDGVYDMFLRLNADVKEDPHVVLLDVDDVAISNVGSWPWPRGLVADGIVLLREFGAAYTVFDIEYLEKSPAGIDSWYLDNGLTYDFDQSFADISSNVADLVEAVASGQLKPRDALQYVGDLNDVILESKKTLISKARSIAVDNDAYLGQAMRLFGSSFATLNVQLEKVAWNDPDLRASAQDRFEYKNLEELDKFPDDAVDFFIPIRPIVEGVKGSGFTNVVIDHDGMRRRIKLFQRVDGRWYAQLAMAPLLDMLGNPKVSISRNAIVLKDAKYPDGSTRTISIPLDATGHMLLNWPKKKFEESYTPHVSFYKLVEIGRKETSLVAILSTIGRSGIWKAYDPSGRLTTLMAQVQDLAARGTSLSDARRAAIASGDTAAFDAYVADKKDYFAATRAFLDGSPERAVSEAVNALASGPAGAAMVAQARADVSQFITDLGTARGVLGVIEDGRAQLATLLSGAMCIIGWTGTSTTDIGVNPFSGEYANVGTHATVANTVLTRSFLGVESVWLSVVLAIALSVGLIAVIRNLSPLRQNVFGFGAVLAVLGLSFVYFRLTGRFVGVLGPTLAVFFSFIVHSVTAFFSNEREKSFLRKAFSTYLSGDVIEELIADPDKLKLGGDSRELTALFTDVRGFSTISEQLTPSQLVDLLNLYLSGMSDIILEERGTIDKYEGDAIISFFGAPIAMPAHARAACRSAVLMKRAEIHLNERFLKDRLSPLPLLTRIGINTGEMVVGNMGTKRKMDYTIMGTAVNLAARLEGVNKRYGTWILASDATLEAAGNEFLARRMDRVRVVGMNQPVQLFEIMDIKADASPDRVDFVRDFHNALDVFTAKNWERAKTAFVDMARRSPDDGPTQYYIHRCEEFLKKPPAENWDGVFNLTEK